MAPPGSRPGSSARPGSAGVPYHHHNQHHQHHGSVGKVSVVTAVAAAKSPGTPRREQSHRLEKAVAVQDPGLRDYVSRGFLYIYFLWPPLLHGIYGHIFLSLGAWWVCVVDGACTARPYTEFTWLHALPAHICTCDSLSGLATGLEFFVWITPGLRERELGGWDRGDMWLATPHFPPWAAAGPICEK